MEARYARITDESLENLRQRMGVEVPRRQPYIEVATRDAIRHFANGIGDLNPLWTDEEYARGARVGCLLAPPCILYSMDLTVSGNVGGLPGVHAMFSGTNWEWFLPIRVDDRILGASRLTDLIEKESAFAGRTYLQGYETVFRNQNDERVCRAKAFCIRAERDTARGKGKYKQISRHTYTPEEIRAIEVDYDQEEVRGARARYWEDVQVGEELTPIVKGPLTITDIVCWTMGWGGLFLRAHKLGLDYRRRHSAATIPDLYGVPDVPERVHWDNDLAREVGVPGAYDYGPQRISWLGNLMTHWIGDDGFLRKLEVEVRRFNIVGDTTWCKGRVERKYVEAGEHLVECQVWAENQRGETTARGGALVRLPSRG